MFGLFDKIITNLLSYAGKPGMHLENMLKGVYTKVFKFQERQEVSMCSMLNLGGLGHAPQEKF